MIRNYASCQLFSKCIKSSRSCQIRACNSCVKTVVGILLVAFTLTAGWSAAKAQQTAKAPRIGYIASAGPDATGTNRGAFQQGLRDLGYTEGKNIAIEFRYLEGVLNRVPMVVAELVELKVDVIVAISPLAIRIAKEKTKTIPIVMVTTADPVATGLIDSLARPGGNVTGITS
jgi:putative tryptophan/tyrosine transport system substrate-binding protein